MEGLEDREVEMSSRLGGLRRVRRTHLGRLDLPLSVATVMRPVREKRHARAARHGRPGSVVPGEPPTCGRDGVVRIGKSGETGKSPKIREIPLRVRIYLSSAPGVATLKRLSRESGSPSAKVMVGGNLSIRLEPTPAGRRGELLGRFCIARDCVAGSEAAIFFIVPGQRLRCSMSRSPAGC